MTQETEKRRKKRAEERPTQNLIRLPRGWRRRGSGRILANAKKPDRLSASTTVRRTDGEPLPMLRGAGSAHLSSRVRLVTVVMAAALACSPTGRFMRAADSADIAADAWEHAGQMANLALVADRVTIYTDAMNAVNTALNASSDAIDAGRSVLPNSFSTLEAYYTQAADLDLGSLSSVSSLIERGRRAEAVMLLRGHLEEVQQKAPDVAATYRNLAIAWRGTAARLKAEQ